MSLDIFKKSQQRGINSFIQQEPLTSKEFFNSTTLLYPDITGSESWVSSQSASPKQITVSLIFAVFVILCILPMTVRPLLIPDETRYAEVPREMINTGDWIVPKINGLRYFEKPVMGYWLSAASIKTFGENKFAVRFPMALSTGLVATLIFFLCGKCYGVRSHLPKLAAFIYLTTLGVVALGTVAVLDTPLTLFLTATLVSFFLATEEKPSSGRERILLLVAGIFAGCAFLTKGFLAFAVPVVTIGPYLIFQGRWKDTLRMLFLPITGALLMSLPWAILIHMREPDFWNYFFWNEHVRRFLSDTAQHKEAFWFFLAVLPAMFMPWVLFLPAAVIGLWKKKWANNSEKRMVIFCLCWFIFPFLFFSASSGKLITYILPCFPPLTILFAIGLHHLSFRDNKKIIQLGMSAAVLFISVILLLLVTVYLFGPEKLQPFQSSWKWFLLCSCLLAMIFLLLRAFRYKEKQAKIILVALSFSMLFFAVHFTIPSQTLTMKAPGTLLTRNANSIDPETFVLSSEEIVRAVSWYLKRDDIYLIEKAGELQYGMDYDDSRHRLLSLMATINFIREHQGRTVLIASQQEYSRWLPVLPEPVSVDSSGSEGYVFVHY